MNLILCGMMGAGKTTIGIKISELTGRRWYDTDGVIVDKYGKISDIFEYYGETHFRRFGMLVIPFFVHISEKAIPTPFQESHHAPPFPRSCIHSLADVPPSEHKITPTTLSG